MAERESGVGHTWRSATEQTLRLTTVVWGAAWLGVVAMALVVGEADPAGTGVSIWLLGLTTCSWVVLVVAPRVPTGQFVVVLAASAIIAIAAYQQPETGRGLTVGAMWLSAAAVSAAVLFQPGRAAAAILALSIAASSLSAAVLVAEGDADAWRVASVVGASAACSGMAVWVASRALRAAADAADGEAAVLRRQALETTAADAHRREVERLTRLLHDTCINTLGAIRGGAGRRDRGAVRERCAYDLAQMDPLARDVGASTLPRLPDLAAIVQRDSRHVGVTTTVTLLGDLSYPINPGVWNAACGAVREALVNVAKHATHPLAQVEISNVGTTVKAIVTDGGPGWDGPPLPGGGIERSIVERVEHSGGLVRITTRIGAPTVIVMTWPRTLALAPAPLAFASERVTASASYVPPAPPAPLNIRRVAVGSGGWIVAYCTISATMFPSPSTLPDALALSVLILCLWFAARLAEPPQPWWVTVLLSIGAMVVLALPTVGNDNCVATVGTGVGIGGATVLVMLVCLLSRSWWQPAFATCAFGAGLLWSHVESGSLRPGCAPDSIVAMSLEIVAVVAILSFRRIFVRLQEQTAAMHEQTAIREGAAVRAAAEQRARDARVRALVSGAGPLLLQIAEGELDPADPEVMERAGHEETALRSLLVLNSELGALGDCLTAAVLDAMAAGRRLDIRSGERVPHPTDAQVALLGELVAAGVGMSPPDSTLPVALFAREDGGALTLVVQTDGTALPVGLTRRLADSGIDVTQIPLEDETLVEAQWSSR